MAEVGRGASMESLKDLNVYPCLHNFLLAHGEAYKIFREGNYEGISGVSKDRTPRSFQRV